MAKPTGTSGPFRATVDYTALCRDHLKRSPFPEAKDDVEDFFASRFIQSMNKHLAASGEKFFLANPVRNAENDFDFTVDSPNGPAYLELLEAAPLTGKYEDAPAVYKRYDYAQFILGEIFKKSAKYPKRKRLRISSSWYM